MADWKLRADTEAEWVGPITVTSAGTPVTGFTVGLIPAGGTATEFTEPTMIDDEAGILVGSDTDWPLVRGRRYAVVVRYESMPSIPLIDVGILTAT